MIRPAKFFGAGIESGNNLILSIGTDQITFTDYYANVTNRSILDWLADEFVGHGWSIKHLQRLIVAVPGEPVGRRGQEDPGVQG